LRVFRGIAVEPAMTELAICYIALPCDL
jgi:hypothetical protein